MRTSSPHQDAGLQTGYRTSLQHRSREYSAALADARRLGGTARHGVRRTPLFMIAFGGGESKVQYVYRKRTPHNRTKKRSTCRQQLWPGATSGEPATTHQGSARAPARGSTLSKTPRQLRVALHGTIERDRDNNNWKWTSSSLCTIGGSWSIFVVVGE